MYSNVFNLLYSIVIRQAAKKAAKKAANKAANLWCVCEGQVLHHFLLFPLCLNNGPAAKVHEAERTAAKVHEAERQ